jgi:hypothetical protein
MRFLLAALLAMHGLLHLLGLQWGKVVGAVWGVAALALLSAAGLLLVGSDRWWMVAAAALVFSQALIATAWSTARAGTILNVVLAVPVILAATTARFEHHSAALRARLLSHVPPAPALVTAAELAPLPPPVRRWLESSGVVGREWAHVVWLRQRGQLRTGADQPWMPAEAQQVFSVDDPAFVWTVSVTMNGLPVSGRDSYQDGRGHMLITVAGLVPVVDARGPQIDQGTLLRFLGEIIWFPSAALAPYLSWEGIDEHHAQATMRWRGVEASGLFTFDEQGRPANVTARRYKSDGAAASLERWEAPSLAWERRSGVLMPVRGTATWKLASGDLEYYRWEIPEVRYNRAALEVRP